MYKREFPGSATLSLFRSHVCPLEVPPRVVGEGVVDDDGLVVHGGEDDAGAAGAGGPDGRQKTGG